MILHGNLYIFAPDIAILGLPFNMHSSCLAYDVENIKLTLTWSSSTASLLFFRLLFSLERV